DLRQARGRVVALAPGRLVEVHAARVRDDVGEREDPARVQRLDGARPVRDVGRGDDRRAAEERRRAGSRAPPAAPPPSA
ncbi:MAG TPA: hypothetical protein VK896_13030, partial [Gaiellaceae bacterium]|nr:hypothetical protein [Gaiellaceae bacterium]